MKSLVKISFIILSVSLMFSTQITDAQNYKAIITDSEHFFYDSTSRNIISIRIDSSKIIGNDIFYYNFKQIRLTDNGCYIIDGNSWLGDQVIEKPDGTFVFTVYPFSPPDSAHTYRILTRSGLNQTWHFYDFHPVNDYVEAKLTEIKYMSFLNLTDSVRVVSLTRKNAAGQIIESPVNTQKLLISKNHGLIKLVKFDEIPYYEMYQFFDLVGKTNPENGINNVKTMQIYDFEPGDEFHTVFFERSYISPNTATKISTISRILERINYPSGDSVSYRIEQCQSSSWLNTGTWYASEHRFDTIIQTYSPLKTPEFETLPLETVVSASFNGWATYTSMGFMVTDTQIPIYDILFKAILPNAFWTNNGGCWGQIIFDGCYYPDYYFKGLGGPYYDCGEPAWGPENELVYYKKGPITWGTPLVCDSLLQVGLPEMPHDQQLSIYPNPTSGEISISVPAGFHFPCVLNIFDLSGRKVVGFTMEQAIQSFDISILPAGLYTYTFTASGCTVLRGKIIRQ